jgi:K+-sensing histidine kinase KdpD
MTPIVFRTDNLIALRELALRFVADASDEELLEHLRRHQPTSGPVTQRRVGGRHRVHVDRWHHVV